jgi:cyclophilin family peptidyl-prolyl cis-trans isomerase
MVSSWKTRRRLPGVPLAALIILLCAATVPVSAADTDAVPADPSSSPPVQADSPQKEGPDDSGSPRVEIVMENGGRIVLELLPKEAPITVERFTELVRDGFYDGLRFHRVESWLVQTGKKDSELPPIEGEMFSQNLKHDKGMVGMARLVDDYDSATTQFYILKECKNALNSEYTIFACVTSGMDVVEKIEKGDEIKTIRFLE